MTRRALYPRSMAIALLTLVTSTSAAAQQETPVLAIRGGTVHTLAGPDIPGGTVLVRDGRIVAVGADVEIPAEATVIDATGGHVYPGIFDAITRLGLTEIGAVDVTNDVTELGTFNPHLLGATAVHPASKHIPVARANGITHAVAAPGARAGGIGGQGSLINLDGWTVEEMLVAPSVGMIVEWPGLQTREFDFATRTPRERSYREAKRQYDTRVDSLEAWLEAARQYRHAVEAGSEVPRDLRLEALGPVVAGELPLLVNANTTREIRDAIAFADRHAVRIVITGGLESPLVAPLLEEKNIPVILGEVFELPTREDMPHAASYAAAGQLAQAGVKFAFGTGGYQNVRLLPYNAAISVAWGLDRDAAIRALTIDAAEILGVADTVGSIEPGKAANLVVARGDPLEIRTEITHVFVNGKSAGLDTRQVELFKKYAARP